MSIIEGCRRVEGPSDLGVRVLHISVFRVGELNDICSFL
jgi:hypothetical protein